MILTFWLDNLRHSHYNQLLQFLPGIEQSELYGLWLLPSVFQWFLIKENSELKIIMVKSSEILFYLEETWEPRRRP